MTVEGLLSASFSFTAGCGKPHVRWWGRVPGRNPRHPTRSSSPAPIAPERLSALEEVRKVNFLSSILFDRPGVQHEQQAESDRPHEID